MQAGTSKLFCNIHALATRSLQQKFHTSACVLKGPRPKNRSFKGKGAPRLARTPARKRLVSSLRPAGKAGTYEVAPREPARSRNKASLRGRDSQLERKPGKDYETQWMHKTHISRKNTRELSSTLGRSSSFPRDDANRLGGGNPHRKPGHASPLRTSRTPKGPIPSPLPDEFDMPETEPLKTLPRVFSSPPLTDGLLNSVHNVLGPDARPSPIQSLALKHLFTPTPRIQSNESEEEGYSLALSPPPAVWRQHLLAAETGSGKSIAYLLPMLQHLKLTEHSPIPLPPQPRLARRFPLNPRGLILAPTHELSRQLAAFAKALLHHMRLRVLCASRANTASVSRMKTTARQLKRKLDDEGFGMNGVTSVGLLGNRPVDVLVGTTTKILEMARGLGWDRAARIKEEWDEARKERAKRWVPGIPEMGLADVEWVVIDEADVLFDRDFESSTRLLLADIARARGYTHPSFTALDSSSGTQTSAPSSPLAYPFHLTLASATIPASLASYLSFAHPKMARLASPRLHRLPTTLTTEHHSWTGGNKNSDIEKRIRRVWADDAKGPTKTRSKVLVFCNKSTKVEDLGLYLKEKGIANVPLTSSGHTRERGSNRHLMGFLKTAEVRDRAISSPTNTSAPARHSTAETSTASSTEPHVLITTSLLSRGLDFSPQVRHVFLVDTPRNMVDFLHRAGRAGRAGNVGRVVLFGKSKGRGSGESKEVRRRVGAITN